MKGVIPAYARLLPRLFSYSLFPITLQMTGAGPRRASAAGLFLLGLVYLPNKGQSYE